MINHYVPLNKLEALEILDKHDCYIMAGGTDLMVQKHRSNQILPNFDKDILYISNLKELNYVRLIDNEIHIGATTKYVELLDSDIIPQMLKDVIKDIASPNIRNMATLAGNIANASPAGDSLVALYILDAKLKLESLKETRIIPIRDFILGVRKIDRNKNEMITEIIIPNINLKYRWVKVGSRKAETISKLSFLGAFEEENGKIIDFRIAFGSVNVTVVRSEEIEKKYLNKTIAEMKHMANAITLDYQDLIKPIDDQRSNKNYRHKVAINLLRDFVTHLDDYE